MSWNLSSVKRQPEWQVKHIDLVVLNSSKPRLADSGIARSSPSIQRSNGAGLGSSVRSNSAIAVAMESRLIGEPGSAAWNFAA